MSRTIRRTRVATTFKGYVEIGQLKSRHDYDGEDSYEQYAKLAMIDFHRDKYRAMSRFERYSTGVPRYVRTIDVKRQARECDKAIHKALERGDFEVVMPSLTKRSYDDYFMYY